MSGSSEQGVRSRAASDHRVPFDLGQHCGARARPDRLEPHVTAH
ncbi:hypothetical protein [Roseibium polysiphoniae]|nr:hypothetical protein [Roseibium polysiphoniae]